MRNILDKVIKRFIESKNQKLNVKPESIGKTKLSLSDFNFNSIIARYGNKEYFENVDEGLITTYQKPWAKCIPSSFP